MAHIKEPKGVDFVNASDPLTHKARKEISGFIRSYKNNASNKKARLPAVRNQRKTVPD